MHRPGRPWPRDRQGSQHLSRVCRSGEHAERGLQGHTAAGAAMNPHAGATTPEEIRLGRFEHMQAGRDLNEQIHMRVVGDGLWHPFRDYSGDIAAAWPLIERATERTGAMFTICFMKTRRQWRVMATKDGVGGLFIDVV